jgi:uncharacterized protein (DUF1697 family)
MNAKMPELKRCFEAAGFKEVKTVLSSGNLIFAASSSSEAVLQRKAEMAMEKQLGRTFLTIVRSIESLEAILDSDPYRAFHLTAGTKRVVTFLRDPPLAKPRLPIALDGARILRLQDGEAFSVYARGPKGPVFMTLIEKTFGREVTTRTWETVKRVAAQ